VTGPAHHTTQYAYDTEDNLISITDANGLRGIGTAMKGYYVFDSTL
jgi:YD repeat-containing protein